MRRQVSLPATAVFTCDSVINQSPDRFSGRGSSGSGARYKLCTRNQRMHSTQD